MLEGVKLILKGIKGSLIILGEREDKSYYLKITSDEREVLTSEEAIKFIKENLRNEIQFFDYKELSRFKDTQIRQFLLTA